MMQLTQLKMKESMKLLIYFLYPDKKLYQHLPVPQTS